MDVTMKAVGVYQPLPIEAPNALVDVTIPKPAPGPQDLLVQVEAVSVNPADYRSRLRKSNDNELAILGWDVAGTVTGVGSAVPSIFSIGDKVFYAGDNTRQGANAEFHVVDHRIVGHRPSSIDSAEAAALPLVSLTAWEAIFDRLGMTINGPNRLRSLLVIGGAGGVGSMAIQLASRIPDVTVIATASRVESRQWCLAMGAEIVIDHHQSLAEGLEENGITSVDAVLLLKSPDAHFPSLASIVTPQGAVCCIVPFLQPPDLNSLMRKSISFHWELMFTRAAFGTPDMSMQSYILNEIASLVDNQSIRSPLQMQLSPFCAETLIAAHKRLESESTIGKVVVTGFQSES